MGKKAKVYIPYIFDDPLVGRTILPFGVTPIEDYIFFDNDKLILKRKTFNLKTIDKFLLVKTEVTPWTSDFRLDLYGLIGTTIELYLVDNSGEKHILVPKFLMNVRNWGQNRLNQFLSELSGHSGLPLEVLNKTGKKTQVITCTWAQSG